MIAMTLNKNRSLVIEVALLQLPQYRKRFQFGTRLIREEGLSLAGPVQLEFK